MGLVLIQNGAGSGFDLKWEMERTGLWGRLRVRGGVNVGTDMGSIEPRHPGARQRSVRGNEGIKPWVQGLQGAGL
uniref:Uncharacterized protein n=1 Tax=Coturnix japonica TaxID=93934 RepID=A0A8C2SSX8_COTJA